MKQKTFGKTEIIDVEKTTSKCNCGNNAVILINNGDNITHYCRNCARNIWLKNKEKYE